MSRLRMTKRDSVRHSDIDGAVVKAEAHSEIWHCFDYIRDSRGMSADTTRPICLRCFKPSTRANPSNSKHEDCSRNPKSHRLADVIT